ncbi:MAG: site-2 protease family protein [Clostridia bacterium]|nr:site-2 protease family protein [Clostridia bacterium]
MTIIRILTNEYSGVTRESLLETIAFLVALLTALVLHEIAHGLVAYWNGDITAKYYGRLSLNPAKHFDIIGLIMMLFVGFGWAKPVPVNPNNFKNRKVGAFTVSLAGIVTNLVLAFLFSALSVFMGRIPVVSGEASYYIVYFLYALGLYTAMLNVNFALFNLLPLYPLDGYRLLSCFVDERKPAMVAIRKYSLYIMLALLLLDRLPFLSGFSPFDWYIGKLGGAILGAFQKFWGLFV